MVNPWLTIPFEDYEAHMGDSAVAQLHTLKALMHERFDRYRPKRIAIAGCCTGNGLEHVPVTTEAVYAIDINDGYLDICKQRYSAKIPGLHAIHADINTDALPVTDIDLIIADLIFEYLDIDAALSTISAMLSPSGVLSITIQRNNDNAFVGETGITSLKILGDIGHEIDPDRLILQAGAVGLHLFRRQVIPVPGGKEFCLMDFRFPPHTP